ncbi:uncharacterized protein LOC131849331 [Achroia grisella]|uniref:uncharacterized protein LOC131849331 n=1 Tax=Achroia grisella TaxID=688607 RepID=UPI0027D27B46|nr:uncharacterized protein LOC131849331 [Achroia grisella]
MSEFIKSNDVKFTRGEKCLFTHIIITFVLIITLVIVYFIHLCLVDHSGNEIFKTTRRHLTAISPSFKEDSKGIGVVYLNTTPVKFICVAHLLRERWSVAPALCVTIRTEPNMAHLLPMWNVGYMTNPNQYMTSDVTRALVYPGYNKDDLNNNIGVFEHRLAIMSTWYDLSNSNGPKTTITYAMTPKKTEIVSLNRKTLYTDDNYRRTVLETNIAKPVPHVQCRQIMTPIIEPRDNEFCVTVGQESNSIIAPGAVVLINSKISGFFSWGHNQASDEPIVILNISYYTAWLEFIISQ